MATTYNLGRVKGTTWYSGAADSASGIASELSAAGKTPIELDFYLNVSNGQVYQYVFNGDILTWSLKGNIKGAKGDPFTIAKTYRSVAEMNAGYANDDVPSGGFVIIETGNVENAENARLYVKGTSSYVYITDLSGSQGIKGEQGETGATGPQGPKGATGPKGDTGAAAGFGTPTASATSLLPGAMPTVNVTASGNDTTKVFSFLFGIPQGAKGDTGAQGAKGETGATGATGPKGDTGAAAGFGTPTASATSLSPGATPTVKVTTSGNDTSKVFEFVFGIPTGATGAKGDTGAKGADGKTPTLSINAAGELIATFA